MYTQIAVTDQDLRASLSPTLLTDASSQTTLPLQGLELHTLHDLRPLLSTSTTLPGAVPMLLQHRVLTQAGLLSQQHPVAGTPSLAPPPTLPKAPSSAASDHDTLDKEGADALECAQLLATLADAMPQQGDAAVQSAACKGPRGPRRAAKRLASLEHMVNTAPDDAAAVERTDRRARSATQSAPPTPSPTMVQHQHASEDDDAWAPVDTRVSKRPRRCSVMHAGLHHRSKRIETGKRWTFEETEAFLAGVEAHGVGNWQKVYDACASLFGQRRTTVDLKDKWRNLVKAVSTPGLIPRSVRLTPVQKQRILVCMQAKGEDNKGGLS